MELLIFEVNLKTPNYHLYKLSNIEVCHHSDCWQMIRMLNRACATRNYVNNVYFIRAVTSQNVPSQRQFSCAGTVWDILLFLGMSNVPNRPKLSKVSVPNLEYEYWVWGKRLAPYRGWSLWSEVYHECGSSSPSHHTNDISWVCCLFSTTNNSDTSWKLNPKESFSCHCSTHWCEPIFDPLVLDTFQRWR